MIFNHIIICRYSFSVFAFERKCVVGMHFFWCQSRLTFFGLSCAFFLTIFAVCLDGWKLLKKICWQKAHNNENGDCWFDIAMIKIEIIIVRKKNYSNSPDHSMEIDSKQFDEWYWIIFSYPIRLPIRFQQQQKQPPYTDWIIWLMFSAP